MRWAVRAIMAAPRTSEVVASPAVPAVARRPSRWIVAVSAALICCSGRPRDAATVMTSTTPSRTMTGTSGSAWTARRKCRSRSSTPTQPRVCGTIPETRTGGRSGSVPVGDLVTARRPDRPAAAGVAPSRAAEHCGAANRRPVSRYPLRLAAARVVQTALGPGLTCRRPGDS